MGMYNEIVEVSSNVVKVTTGGIEKEYNKTDLKCSATDIMVFIFYYTDSKNKIVASWNAYQADLYGYTLSTLKTYIDGLLSSNKLNLNNVNLGNVGEYATQADAIADGLVNGDVYMLPKSGDVHVLAIVKAIIEKYSFGSSTIGFVSDGSNGWNVSALVAPTSFDNVPDGLSVDSTHFDIEFWASKNRTIIYDADIVANATENTGANGAGVYAVRVIYSFSDGTAFTVYGYYLVDATNTILKSVVVNGITVNSVNGLTIDVTLDVTQTNCSYGFLVYGVQVDDSSYYIGDTVDGAITLQPLTKNLIFTPNFDADFTNDYDGDPALTQTIIIS